MYGLHREHVRRGLEGRVSAVSAVSVLSRVNKIEQAWEWVAGAGQEKGRVGLKKVPPK